MGEALILALLCAAVEPAPSPSSAPSSSSSIAVGCQQLRLTLDPRLTPAVVERDWGTAAEHTEDSAALELVDCDGRLLQRLPLDAPLAKLDGPPLHGAPAPSVLVTTDLTAPAGSYNGPLTRVVQVADGHLSFAEAIDETGHTSRVAVALTGKAAWRRRHIGGREVLLSVSSQLQSHTERFVTRLSCFVPGQRGAHVWQVRTRTEPGLWESDADFPEQHHFACAPANRH